MSCHNIRFTYIQPKFCLRSKTNTSTNTPKHKKIVRLSRFTRIIRLNIIKCKNNFACLSASLSNTNITKGIPLETHRGEKCKFSKYTMFHHVLRKMNLQLNLLANLNKKAFHKLVKIAHNKYFEWRSWLLWARNYKTYFLRATFVDSIFKFLYYCRFQYQLNFRISQSYVPHTD